MNLERKRPALTDRPSPEKSTTTQTHSQSKARCRHCSRPLRAHLSVFRCAGPVCWRRTHHQKVGRLMSETDQLRAVGPDPTVADLFVGALLFSTSAEVLEVARFVDVEDVDEPGQAVLESVVALARRGVPPSSQLVLDDLKRCGKLTRTRGLWLASATASGACASAHGRTPPRWSPNRYGGRQNRSAKPLSQHPHRIQKSKSQS